MNPRDLPDRWRSEADRYDQDGVPGHAALLCRVANELATALAADASELLTVAEAAAESGFSEETLRRKVREGDIPATRNRSRRSRIRLKRRDLPRKPHQRLEVASRDGYDVDEDARNIAQLLEGQR